jgi:hypothetical protein
MGGVEWLVTPPRFIVFILIMYRPCTKFKHSEFVKFKRGKVCSCLFVCRVRILLLENERAIDHAKTLDDAQHVHTIF